MSNHLVCNDTSGRLIFPFLLLPCEIRLQIYSMLAPNVIVTLRKPPHVDVDLTIDGNFCGPAILQANRQIYNEAIYKWYGQTTFNAMLHYRSHIATLHVFRRRFKSLSNIPTVFYFISTLRIKLYLEDPHGPAKIRKGYTAMLYKLFPRGSNPRCLKSLEIDLVLAAGCWSWREFCRMLECHIHPFRHFGGYEKIKFTLNFQGLNEYKYPHTENYLAWCVRFKAYGEAFLEKLDEDMFSVPKVIRCGCS